MQPATAETKIKSLDLSTCVHHYTLRAPCPKGQRKHFDTLSVQTKAHRGIWHHSCACVFRCECFWHVLNRGTASSGRAVRGQDCHWAENEFTARVRDPIIHKSGVGASGTWRYSRCASRRMFTRFPSPLRRETACRSHDYQVRLRLPLHTFRGPGATPHGQVLLSDRFRQTLLTTSLEVVQAIIYDRVLEAGI